MRGSLTLGRIRDIPIRAHFSLLLAVPYLAFLMATRFEPVAGQAGLAEGQLHLPPLAWGLILAVLLFGCVLAHELGHALVALKSGGQVSAITLMLLGGVSELRGLPKTPRVEGWVAAAGPLVSLGLGLSALGLHRLLPGPADVRFGLYYLGQINLALAIFNLLPAFPMDGGRLLRALLAARLPRAKATRIAAAAGTLFAAAFVVLGFLSGNLLLALIGLFVWSGAHAENEAVRREEQFHGLRVRDLMSRLTEPVHVAAPVTEAAWRMAESHTTAVAVIDDHHVVGIVALHHLEALKPEERERTTVGAITQRNVPQLEADEPVGGALERMAERESAEAPVLDHGELVGILEVSDLARHLRLRQLAASAPQRAPVWRPPLGEDRPGTGLLHLSPGRRAPV